MRFDLTTRRRRQHELDASISCWSLISLRPGFCSHTLVMWLCAWFFGSSVLVVMHFVSILVGFWLAVWLIEHKRNKSPENLCMHWNWYIFRFEMLSIRHRERWSEKVIWIFLSFRWKCLCVCVRIDWGIWSFCPARAPKLQLQQCSNVGNPKWNINRSSRVPIYKCVCELTTILYGVTTIVIILCVTISTKHTTH